MPEIGETQNGQFYFDGLGWVPYGGIAKPTITVGHKSASGLIWDGRRWINEKRRTQQQHDFDSSLVKLFEKTSLNFKGLSSKNGEYGVAIFMIPDYKRGYSESANEVENYFSDRRKADCQRELLNMNIRNSRFFGKDENKICRKLRRMITTDYGILCSLKEKYGSENQDYRPLYLGDAQNPYLTPKITKLYVFLDDGTYLEKDVKWEFGWKIEYDDEDDRDYHLGDTIDASQLTILDHYSIHTGEPYTAWLMFDSKRSSDKHWEEWKYFTD